MSQKTIGIYAVSSQYLNVEIRVTEVIGDIENRT